MAHPQPGEMRSVDLSDREALPAYYSRLAPFEKLFRRGTAILTYHHVAPRRRGARLKGLYVSPRLFARQMAEIASAGFSAPPFETVLMPSDEQRRRVYLTFDDGFRDVFENGLSLLTAHGFHGIQFLVSDRIGGANLWQQKLGDVCEPLMDEAEVRQWLAAGQEIGSHTRTHPRLTQLSEDAAREEIGASKKSLEDRFGVPIHHFCYPYGDWNQRVSELVAEAGYQSACTTENGIYTPGEAPFALKRFTARYPTRSLKALWARLRGAQSRGRP